MAQAKKREGSIVSITKDHDGTILAAVKGFAPLRFNPAKASLANRKYAEFHGWKQRLSDKAAVSADTDTGKTDAQMKYDGIVKLITFYEAGGDDWNMKSAGGGSRFDSGLVILAMIRAFGKTADEIEAIVKATEAKRELDRDGALKAWAETDKVKAAIKAIETERAMAKVTLSADDLLAEMLAEDPPETDEDEEDNDDEQDDTDE